VVRSCLKQKKTALAFAKEKQKFARFGFDAANFTGFETNINIVACLRKIKIKIS